MRSQMQTITNWNNLNPPPVFVIIRSSPLILTNGTYCACASPLPQIPSSIYNSSAPSLSLSFVRFYPWKIEQFVCFIAARLPPSHLSICSRESVGQKSKLALAHCVREKEGEGAPSLPRPTMMMHQLRISLTMRRQRLARFGETVPCSPNLTEYFRVSLLTDAIAQTASWVSWDRKYRDAHHEE